MAKLPGDPRANQYIAADGQTKFTYHFRIYTNVEIVVNQNDLDLELGNDYTVTDVDDPAGGEVILTTGAAANDIITLTGNSWVQPREVFSSGGIIKAEELNNNVTQLDNLISEVVTESNRALKQKVYDPTISIELPAPIADRCIKWDDTAEHLILSSFDPDEISAQTAADVIQCDADVVLCDADVVECQAQVVKCQDEVVLAEEQATLASGFADNASDSADAAAASAASVDFSGVDTSIIPDITDTHDLGTDTIEWNKLYVKDINSTGTILVHNLRPETTATYALGGPARRWTNGFINNVVCSTINGEPVKNRKAIYSYLLNQGVQGGDYVPPDSWQVRPINTEVYDTIGSSLATNQITLPAGTYICDVNFQAFYTDKNSWGIYDVTNSTYLWQGHGSSGGNIGNVDVGGKAYFVAATSIVIEIRQNSTRGMLLLGMGYARDIAGMSEIYLTVVIEKEA